MKSESEYSGSEEEVKKLPPRSTAKKSTFMDEYSSEEEIDFRSKSRLGKSATKQAATSTKKNIVYQHHHDLKLDTLLKKIDDAVLKLQEYTVPDKIPCRESEKEVVRSFVQEGLANEGLSHCLYISGVPGIGKTISVLEVLKQIREEQN